MASSKTIQIHLLPTLLLNRLHISLLHVRRNDVVLFTEDPRYRHFLPPCVGDFAGEAEVGVSAHGGYICDGQLEVLVREGATGDGFDVNEAEVVVLTCEVDQSGLSFMGGKNKMAWIHTSPTLTIAAGGSPI